MPDLRLPSIPLPRVERGLAARRFRLAMLSRDVGPMTESAREDIAMEVHFALASLLPRDGRDYEVSVSFPSDVDPLVPVVTLTPLTEMGEAWCDSIAGRLEAALGSSVAGGASK